MKLGETAFMADIKRMDTLGQLKRNLDSPPLKDTVQIPSGGYTIFRFYADNPGAWLIHCHMENDAEMGMMAVLRVGKESDLPPVDMSTWPQCGNYQNKVSQKPILIQIKNIFNNVFSYVLSFF